MNRDQRHHTGMTILILQVIMQGISALKSVESIGTSRHATSSKCPLYTEINTDCSDHERYNRPIERNVGPPLAAVPALSITETQAVVQTLDALRAQIAKLEEKLAPVVASPAPVPRPSVREYESERGGDPYRAVETIPPRSPSRDQYHRARREPEPYGRSNHPLEPDHRRPLSPRHYRSTIAAPNTGKAPYDSKCDNDKRACKTAFHPSDTTPTPNVTSRMHLVGHGRLLHFLGRHLRHRKRMSVTEGMIIALGPLRKPMKNISMSEGTSPMLKHVLLLILTPHLHL